RGFRRGGRRVHPRKVGVLELDRGEIVRLEVRGEVPGVRANDVARINADDVARTVKVDVRGHRILCDRPAFARVDRHADLQGRAPGERPRQGIWGAELGDGSTPELWQELVLGDLVSHAATAS